MRRNLPAYATFQVFLNYPFDGDFSKLAEAMSFAVVAGGLLPVCAHDLSAPDKPRLEMLVEAIQNCRYSAHDLSRARGEGENNFARMNMPVEMGMALFFALHSQRREHRCQFFVAAPHDYRVYASDLAGLDPKPHGGSEERILSDMYDWLRGIVPAALSNAQPTIAVVEQYHHFKNRIVRVRGSGPDGALSHDETREVMYQLCAELGWWDWRSNRMGKDEFPIVPLASV